MAKSTFEHWLDASHKTDRTQRRPRRFLDLVRGAFEGEGAAALVFVAVLALSIVSFTTTATSLLSLLTGSAADEVSEQLRPPGLVASEGDHALQRPTLDGTTLPSTLEVALAQQQPRDVSPSVDLNISQDVQAEHAEESRGTVSADPIVNESELPDSASGIAPQVVYGSLTNAREGASVEAPQMTLETEALGARPHRDPRNPLESAEEVSAGGDEMLESALGSSSLVLPAWDPLKEMAAVETSERLQKTGIGASVPETIGVIAMALVFAGLLWFLLWKHTAWPRNVGSSLSDPQPRLRLKTFADVLAIAAIICVAIVAIIGSGMALDYFNLSQRLDSESNFTNFAIAVGTTFGIQIIMVVLSFYIGGHVLRLLSGPHSFSITHWASWIFWSPLRLLGIGSLLVILFPFISFSIAFSFATFHHNLETDEAVRDSAIQEVRNAMTDVTSIFRITLAKYIETSLRERQRPITLAPINPEAQAKLFRSVDTLLRNESYQVFSQEQERRQNALIDTQKQIFDTLLSAYEAQIRFAIATRQIDWEHRFQIDAFPLERALNEQGPLGHERLFTALSGPMARWRESPNWPGGGYTSIVQDVIGPESESRVGCEPAFFQNENTDFYILRRLAVLQTVRDGLSDPRNHLMPFNYEGKNEDDLNALIGEVVRGMAYGLLANRLAAFTGDDAATERSTAMQLIDERTVERLSLDIEGTEAEVNQIGIKLLNADPSLGQEIDELLNNSQVYLNTDKDGNPLRVRDRYGVETDNYCTLGAGDHFVMILTDMEDQARLFSSAAQRVKVYQPDVEADLLAELRSLTNKSSQARPPDRQQAELLEYLERAKELDYDRSPSFSTAVETWKARIEQDFNELRRRYARTPDPNDVCTGLADESPSGCLSQPINSCRALNAALSDVRGLTVGVTDFDYSEAGQPYHEYDCAALEINPADYQSLDLTRELLKQIDTEEKSRSSEWAASTFEEQKVLADRLSIALQDLVSEVPDAQVSAPLRRALSTFREKVDKTYPVASVGRSWDRMLGILGIQTGLAAQASGAGIFSTPDNATPRETNNVTFLQDRTAFRVRDVMDVVAMLLAITIDIMIVVFAVLIAYMRRGALYSIARSYHGKLSEEQLEEAISTAGREDPTLFSRIAMEVVPHDDSDYPFLLDLESIPDTSIKRRAARVVRLLNSHAVLLPNEDFTFKLSAVAQAFIEKMAGRERYFDNSRSVT